MTEPHNFSYSILGYFSGKGGDILIGIMFKNIKYDLNEYQNVRHLRFNYSNFFQVSCYLVQSLKCLNKPQEIQN